MSDFTVSVVSLWEQWVSKWQKDKKAFVDKGPGKSFPEIVDQRIAGEVLSTQGDMISQLGEIVIKHLDSSIDRDNILSLLGTVSKADLPDNFE